MRKEQKVDNKLYPYCGKVFVQKSNRDCRVKNQQKTVILTIHLQMKLLMMVLLFL